MNENFDELLEDVHNALVHALLDKNIKYIPDFDKPVAEYLKKLGYIRLDSAKEHKELISLKKQIDIGTVFKVPYNLGTKLYFIVLNRTSGKLSIFDTELWVYISIFDRIEHGTIKFSFHIEINDPTFDNFNFAFDGEYDHIFDNEEDAKNKLNEMEKKNGKRNGN